MLTQFLCILLLVVKSWQLDLGPNQAQTCVSACQECYDTITFGTTVETDDHYTGMCQDTLKWESTYLCAKLFCTPWQTKTGVDYITMPCRTKVHIDVPLFATVIANYSDEAIQAMPLVDYTNTTTPSGIIYNSTLLPTRDLWQQEYKSIVSTYQLVWKSLECSGTDDWLFRTNGSMWNMPIVVTCKSPEVSQMP